MAIGGVLGAAGSVLVGIVPWSEDHALVALAALAVAGIALDRGVLGLRLPSWQRQVDENWLSTYRGWVYGFGYGVQLGSAVATIVPRSITYVALGAAVLTGSVTGGLVIGGVFGLVRALPLLATARVRTAEALRGLHRRVDRLRRPVDRLSVAAQAGLALLGFALVAG
jgi:uncharacterized membrane protein YdjX (TVP38/TMEM64 family)